jgi:tetratricopeptide (TPR) repeat protein
MHELLAHPFRSGTLIAGIFYFGSSLLKLFPVLVRFLPALLKGAVKWPGPKVRDLDPQVNMGRRLAGIPQSHLFSEFSFYNLGLFGAFCFCLLTLLSDTSYFSAQIQIHWGWQAYLMMLGAILGGMMSIQKAEYFSFLLNRLLNDLSAGTEPRQADGLAAEAEYAIEHPLLYVQRKGSSNPQALALFSEATTFFQNGNRQKASVLYQEATNRDPQFHENARRDLTECVRTAEQKDLGAIYYWLGAHSEYLMDLRQAKDNYEKAIQAFHQLGYKNREARAHCNLGNVKMNMKDSSGMDEFEQAIALNPRNGTAHINIGTVYYRISERGDPRFERAMEAFSDAIVADPILYGPIVIARLREIGYTWKEDLEDITQRVETKNHKKPQPVKQSTS